MEIQENIVNKVALSGLVTIDLANYATTSEIVTYDIKDNLFHGLILREKDFREFIKNHNWEVFQDKHVAICCTADAIVPTWAYMLLATKLAPYATSVNFGDKDEVLRILFLESIKNIDYSEYIDQRVVVKGCGEVFIPEAAFVSFTTALSKVAKSIMYGEPCSTVPVFKRKS